MDAQLKKGVLDLVILSYIANADSYGYDIYQYVNQRLDISESTVYPILRKYVTDKYCETYLKESNEGPARKYFKVTTLGKQRLKHYYHEYVLFNKEVNNILEELKVKEDL